jgi:transcriptional regulator of NAD metabolism
MATSRCDNPQNCSAEDIVNSINIIGEEGQLTKCVEYKICDFNETLDKYATYKREKKELDTNIDKSKNNFERQNLMYGFSFMTLVVVGVVGYKVLRNTRKR